MSYLKTNGIIIKEIQSGEDDKFIILLTPNYGKISCFVKGARKNKTKFGIATQFLCYSEFILFKNKNMYLINSIKIIEPFYDIRMDIEKLTYAAHFSDIINDVIQENQSSSKVLKLFLNSLYMICKKNKNPKFISSIFELKLLAILGYSPYIEDCSVCNIGDLEDEIWFSFTNNGFICKECVKKDSSKIKISIGTMRAIIYIIKSRINDLFNFEVSEDILMELEKIATLYLRQQFERDYTKLDYLKLI